MSDKNHRNDEEPEQPKFRIVDRRRIDADDIEPADSPEVEKTEPSVSEEDKAGSDVESPEVTKDIEPDQAAAGTEEPDEDAKEGSEELRGVDTYQIETPEELRKGYFIGRRRIGVTAGASTPDWLIEEVILEIRKYGFNVGAGDCGAVSVNLPGE
ncbi:unnamed protein product [marine sediment metagenome]|uniref:Uncharacterized protein n=1 Tax=marine sediment metagenome TaxID=412755 RepID=X1R8B5_9ZZZZ